MSVKFQHAEAIGWFRVRCIPAGKQFPSQGPAQTNARNRLRVGLPYSGDGDRQLQQIPAITPQVRGRAFRVCSRYTATANRERHQCDENVTLLRVSPRIRLRSRSYAATGSQLVPLKSLSPCLLREPFRALSVVKCLASPIGHQKGISSSPSLDCGKAGSGGPPGPGGWSNRSESGASLPPRNCTSDATISVV